MSSKKGSVKYLVDSVITPVSIIEEKTTPSGGNLMVVEGQFGDTTKPTANKRFYKREVMEPNITRLNDFLKERSVYGELDHPDDGRTRLQRVSHIITKLHINEEGRVIGRAEILDTQRGRDLQALLKAGCKVGVSSRGYGTTIPGENGIEEVQKDYNLQTYDFVADPADQGAYPSVVFEGIEMPLDKALQEVIPDTTGQTTESLREATNAEEIRQTERERTISQMREQFKNELNDKLAVMKSSLRDEVEKELIADPAVAGSLGTLRKIGELLRPFLGGSAPSVNEELQAVMQSHMLELASKDQTIEALQAEIEQLQQQTTSYARIAREAGYQFYLEKTLGQDPDNSLIRTLLGDVLNYQHIDHLKARVEEIKDELVKHRTEENARLEAIRAEAEKQAAVREAERRASLAEVQGLQTKMREMTSTLEETISITRKLQEENAELKAQLYAEKRIVATPGVEGSAIRQAVESRKIQSLDSVDSLIKENRTVPIAADSNQAEQMRSRLRSWQRGGKSPSSLEEEQRQYVSGTPAQATNGSVRGSSILESEIGQSFAEIERLAKV